MKKPPPPPKPPPPRRIKNVPLPPKDKNTMKEKHTKTEKIIGMIGFVSIIMVLGGLLILIWSQPWIPIAKIILTGCVGFTVSVIYFKGNEIKENEKRMEEIEERIKKLKENRKPFQERIADLEKKDINGR